MNASVQLQKQEQAWILCGSNCSRVNDDLFVPLYRHSTSVTVILSFIYVFTFVLALIGNVLVIAVVFRNPWMRNVTNFFVVNLALADILVTLFCMPITLLHNIFTGKALFSKSKILKLYRHGHTDITFWEMSHVWVSHVVF